MGCLLLILGAGIIAYIVAYWEYDDKGWAALWATAIIMLSIMIALFAGMIKLIV